MTKGTVYGRHDLTLLEQRYMKLMKIAALPREQWREAIGALLDEAKRENELREAGSIACDDKGQEAMTKPTEHEQDRLPGPTTAPPFPKRSPEELRRLIVTFLDLMIAGARNKPN